MEDLRHTGFAVDRAKAAVLTGTVIVGEALYQWASELPASADQLYEKDGLQVFTFCIGPNTHLGLVNHTSGQFASGSISGGGNTVPTGSLASGEAKEYDLRTTTANMPVTVRINSPSITLPFNSECQPEGGGTPSTTVAPPTTTTSTAPPTTNPETTTTVVTAPPAPRQTVPKATTTTVKAVAPAPAVTQPPPTPPSTEAPITTLPPTAAITVTTNVFSDERQGVSAAVPTTSPEAAQIDGDETLSLNDPAAVILAVAAGGTGLVILARRRLNRANLPRPQRSRTIKPLHFLRRSNGKEHKKVA